LPHLKKHPLPNKSIQPVSGKVKTAKTTLLRPPISVNGINASFIGKMNTYANGLSQEPIKNLNKLLQITSKVVTVIVISFIGHPIRLKVRASTTNARN
jgi:hypothetical protein